MNKEELIYKKLKEFQDGTGLGTRACATIFSISSATIVEIYKKTPNAGIHSKVLQKLELFELFPEMAIYWINQTLPRLNIENRRKIVRYLQNDNCEKRLQIKKIDIIRDAGIHAIDKIIRKAIQEEEDESRREIYFNQIIDAIASIDYTSWQDTRSKTRKNLRKKNKNE